MKPNQGHEIISLENFHPLFFDPIKKENFFPTIKKLFVRRTMKRLMKRYTWDSTKMDVITDFNATDWILIGSPGIGKSLLFFLAAVWKASKGKQPVVYIRKSGKEPMSIFYMFPDGVNTVGMYFKRLSETEYEDKIDTLKTLKQIRTPLREALNAHAPLKQRPLWFVVGPKHDDKANSIEETAHFRCTSGGFPQPKSEDALRVCVWVLDAWTKKEMTRALFLLYDLNEEEAHEIYELSGGCMRNATRALNEIGRDRVMDDLASNVRNIPDQNIRIITKQSINQNLGYNLIRMIFVENKKKKHMQMTDIGNFYHIVDSKFVLKLLENRGGLPELRRAYMESEDDLKKASIAAGFYELYWHQWFKITKPCNITFLQDATGDQPLSAKNQYWVPKNENFPDIDAALVYGTTVYGFQYIIQKSKRKDFNVRSFSTGFLSPLLHTFPDIERVSVLFVSPLSEFKLPKWGTMMPKKTTARNKAMAKRKTPSNTEVPAKSKNSRKDQEPDPSVTWDEESECCTVNGISIAFASSKVLGDVRKETIQWLPFIK
jgi:hypothetical protein